MTNVPNDLLRVTLSIARDFHDREYAGMVYHRATEQPRVTSYVSKYAYSLLSPGAERGYVHERLDKLSTVQRSFGPSFFRSLSREVFISRELDHLACCRFFGHRDKVFGLPLS
jgi:hypothetical protein